jgi:hypothetical protein
VSVDRKESTGLKEALNKALISKKVFKSNKSRLSTSWPLSQIVGIKNYKICNVKSLEKNLFQAAKKLLESHFNQLTFFQNGQNCVSIQNFYKCSIESLIFKHLPFH